MRFLLVLVLFVLLSVSSFAGPDFASVFSDCDYYRYAGTVVTADTLWFTTLQAGAGSGLDYDGGAAELRDVLYPVPVPVGYTNDGELARRMRPVRRVLAFGRAPFSYRLSTNGLEPGDTGYGAAAVYFYADTLGVANTGPSAIVDAYPCVASFAYPDSLHIKVASDTVFVWVGY